MDPKTRVAMHVLLRTILCVAMGLLVVCLLGLYLLGLPLLLSLSLLLLLPFARRLLLPSLFLFYVLFLVWLPCYAYIPDSTFTFVMAFLTFGGGTLLNWRVVGLVVGLVEAVSHVGMLATASRLWRIANMGFRKLKKSVEAE